MITYNADDSSIIVDQITKKDWDVHQQIQQKEIAGIRITKESDAWKYKIELKVFEFETNKELLSNVISQKDFDEITHTYESINTSSLWSLEEYMIAIKENTHFPANLQLPTQIIGDVYDYFPFSHGLLLEMTDSVEGKERLSVYYPNKFPCPRQLKDCKVIVTGILDIYHGHIQVKATDIDVLNSKSTKRCQQIQNWTEEYKNTRLTKGTPEKLKRRFETLHVISSSSTGAGYRDFIKNVAHNMPRYIENPSPFRIKEHFVTMTAENIAHEIYKINQTEYDYACICIIRGGGSPYDLTDFNNIVLVKAISQSSLPIIAGIGHTADTFLIDDVVDRSFDTPTQAGIFLFRNLQCNEWLTEKEKFQKISTQIETLCEKQQISGLKWKLYKNLQKMITNLLN